MHAMLAVALKGFFPLLVTPYTERAELDVPVFVREAEFAAEKGAAGIIWPTAGEVETLESLGEYRAGLDALASAAAEGRFKATLTAICPGKTSSQAIERAKFACGLGKKYGLEIAILARPPDDATNQTMMAEHYCALGHAVDCPVIIQTYNKKSPQPDVKLLIDLAAEFPGVYGWVKDESPGLQVNGRMKELLAASPVIKTVFSGWGGKGFLYQGPRIGTRGLISQRAGYADLLSAVVRRVEAGFDSSDPKLCDLYSKYLLMANLGDVFSKSDDEMRGSHLYVLVKRGVFRNTYTRVKAPKDDPQGREWMVEEYVPTDAEKAEIEARMAYVFGKLGCPVDCFWGSGGTEVGPSEGVARGWTWEKAQTGNCHPGATLPFGWMSAVAYSGAYPTGYGVWARSSGGPAKRILDRPEAWGITHVQHSGVGAIRQYYNFIRITPCVDGADLSKRSRLTDERAEPGYYAASLPDYGSSFELAAVSTTAMAHRYRYASPGGRLEIDLKSLATFDSRTNCIDRVDVKVQTKDTWSGTIWPYGVPVHFALRMKGAEESVLAISRESIDAALSEADAALAAGFDAARAKSALAWEKTLGRIRAKFADPKLERRFYSAFYHSLLNPSDQRVGFCDFATVWDMYRTQLPLVMLSQPETADRIARSMFETSEKHGFFPNWFTMLPRYERSDRQAIALPAYVMADFFRAGAVKEKDVSRLMPFFEREFSGIDLAKYSQTHILDLAGAYDAAATVAAETGNNGKAKAWREKSAIWRTAYDPQTGLMPKGAKYYEGNEMNYSFRPHVDMDKRMELIGGKAKFAKLLDDFFAFSDDLTGWTPETDRIKRPGRFEGLNNESDMDSISSYYFVGRPDRVAELHDLIRRTRFADGAGGLPGNNDSGATSSWYVLSSLGLVPQSGSPYWFVTIPAVESAEVDVRGGMLSISVDSHVRTAPGLAKAYFNGRELADWRIPSKELISGGNLAFKAGGSRQ